MSDFFVGSSNAMWRFGLVGDSTNPNPLATPKFSDMWYLELYTNDGNQTNIYSKSVRSISEVQLNVTHTTIDQYGKRIHVPQKVDFPSVTMTLYDTIDGKIFDLVSSIYQYSFKNNNTDTKEINSSIRNISSSGIKQKPTGVQPQNHFFTRINIYHFGGIGRGIKHKITLSNPLVSNIAFSTNDYSVAELKTVTITLEPENVFIDSKADPLAIPAWISQGVRKPRD